MKPKRIFIVFIGTAIVITIIIEKLPIFPVHEENLHNHLEQKEKIPTTQIGGGYSGYQSPSGPTKAESLNRV